MFDWFTKIADRVDANWDAIVPKAARVMGWICIVVAIIFAVIAYRRFISM